VRSCGVASGDGGVDVVVKDHARMATTRLQSASSSYPEVCHVRIPSAGHGALPTYGEGMSAVPTSVGVFFGQVDKRPKGWYWADTNEKSKGAIRGPFQTKEQAVEDALHSLSRDEPAERGAA
jgi:hypothetical protein